MYETESHALLPFRASLPVVRPGSAPLIARLIDQPPKERRIELRALLPNPPRDVVRVFVVGVAAALFATWVRPIFEPTALLSAVRKVPASPAERYNGWPRPLPDIMLPIR